ncbi:MAG: hypothetical protein ITD49_00900 [Candidatus Nitrotoga sp.]|nr:hypothetical protein [Candidatus Nitrotoga sp.]
MLSISGVHASITHPSRWRYVSAGLTSTHLPSHEIDATEYLGNFFLRLLE